MDLLKQRLKNASSHFYHLSGNSWQLMEWKPRGQPCVRLSDRRCPPEREQLRPVALRGQEMIKLDGKVMVFTRP